MHLRTYGETELRSFLESVESAKEIEQSIAVARGSLDAAFVQVLGHRGPDCKEQLVHHCAASVHQLAKMLPEEVAYEARAPEAVRSVIRKAIGVVREKCGIAPMGASAGQASDAQGESAACVQSLCACRVIYCGEGFANEGVLMNRLGVKKPWVELDMAAKLTEKGLIGFFPEVSWPPTNAVCDSQLPCILDLGIVLHTALGSRARHQD